MVHNALTGEVLCDLAQRYLQGVADVDGDGAAELFLAASDSVFVPQFGRIELVKISGRKPLVLWSRENAGWAMYNLPRLGTNWSTSATQGMQHVLLADNLSDKGCAFGVRLLQTHDAAPSQLPTTVEFVTKRYEAPGQTKTLWQVENLIGQLETVAMTGSNDQSVSAMINVSLAANTKTTLITHGVESRVVGNEPLGLKVSSPIAARLRPGGPMMVISEGPGQHIFVIEPPTAGGRRPQVHWQRPGRGMADGSRYVGPLATDLDGDGGCEIVVARQAPRGHAVLAAYRHDGESLWYKYFEQTSGAQPVWNISAITFWWPGHFRYPDKVDLFVNVRRGHMHSDMGYLLDGGDGKTIWSHRKAIAANKFQWGYAGTPLGIADIDGDCKDELINLYPVCYWVAEGEDGRITTAKGLETRQEIPAWAAYGEPIIHDFTGNGQAQILLDSVYILALLDIKGAPIWYGPARAEFPTSPDKGNVDETTNIKHALVDFDGDGQFEIASAGYGNEVRAIDPTNGKVLWSVESAKPTCLKVVSANIDGRGGDEILYIANDRLIAISGDRLSGRVLWKWQGPAALSMPAIADVDEDDQAEIILQDADGTIHCLDSL
ncbi:MAG: hypothetical protein JSV03_00445 [Planctomycetota bacterium]|nr:MAG: hypothetical protein JSV03_00445 [Planctomycetota bacterium]